jgi:hypothetical protein
MSMVSVRTSAGRVDRRRLVARGWPARPRLTAGFPATAALRFDVAALRRIVS